MRIPQLHPAEVIRALHHLGFKTLRTRGSHVRLAHPDGRKVTVPKHNRPLFIGTLHFILRQAEISLEELLDNL